MADDVDDDGKPFHFYASNHYEWVCTAPERDLPLVIKTMERYGYEYMLWLVPGAWNSDYKIKRYEPQVEGAVWLGNFEPPKSKSKTKKIRDEMFSTNVVRNWNETI